MSSVPKSRRKPATMECHAQALKIRKEITRLLLHDFGVKSRIWSINYVEDRYNMSDKDKQTIEEISQKYGMNNEALVEFPDWFIDKQRDLMLSYLEELVDNIETANSIYPVKLFECDLRREYQDKAITACKRLLSRLQYLNEVLPVSAQKYMHYVELLNKELIMLKGWRKHTNKMEQGIKDKMQKEKEKSAF